VVSDGFVPHDLNGFSPERAIDQGMPYFDENFWSDPTHV
jgi:hypothetical protein